MNRRWAQARAAARITHRYKHMHRLSRTVIGVILSCVSQAAYAKRGPAPVVPPLAVNGVTYSASPSAGMGNNRIRNGLRPCGGSSRQEGNFGRPSFTKSSSIPTWKWMLNLFVWSQCPQVDGHLKHVDEKGDTFKVNLATGKILKEGGVVMYYDGSDIDESQHAYLPTMLCSVAVLVTLCVLLSLSSVLQNAQDQQQITRHQ